MYSRLSTAAATYAGSLRIYHLSQSFKLMPGELRVGSNSSGALSQASSRNYHRSTLGRTRAALGDGGLHPGAWKLVAVVAFRC